MCIIIILYSCINTSIRSFVKTRLKISIVQTESLNIEKRYSCRAMLNLEPVAPPATGGISQINKSSLVVHMWSCTCVRWLNWIANTSTVCYMITYSFINKHFNCAHVILKEAKLWNCKSIIKWLHSPVN